MKFARLRPGFTPKTTILALLSALVCAGASWTFNPASALAPQPADLWTPLSATLGSTASAYVVQQYPSTVLLWPATWTSGTSIAVGTPCSTYGLPPGARPTKRIEGSGSLRRCVNFDTTKPPPANAVRPLPPMPVASGTGTTEASDAVTATVVDVVTVISWPADWKLPSDITPYPGQRCSDFPLLAGESTDKHIQSSGGAEEHFRCVRLKDPVVFPGP